ncbi:DegV family protein [Shouchella shacheensis]|uniref:DegV family protein n=1 Tax=Shouchella shacheensis TaxID=1649580 RepID=UPI00073FE489|nr:DegV family protein [Shouchella shacheensis]
MANIKIVTDSTADLPKEVVDRLGITVIPLNVHFSNNEQYEDGVTLSPEEFYTKLKTAKEMPRTSQPSPLQFENLYKKLKQEGAEQILSIHLSSALSGTLQAATIAKEAVAEQIDVHVCDSKRASYAIGVIVAEIAEVAANGASYAACVERLEQMLEETQVYFLVDTLEYLQKNGRIGKASALFGSLLKVKPILSLNKEGEVYPHERVRGQKKAIERLISLLEEEYGQAAVHVGAFHAENESLAKELMAQVEERFNVSSRIITTIGAVIGAHVGPGTVALTMSPAK